MARALPNGVLCRPGGRGQAAQHGVEGDTFTAKSGSRGPGFCSVFLSGLSGSDGTWLRKSDFSYGSAK